MDYNKVRDVQLQNSDYASAGFPDIWYKNYEPEAHKAEVEKYKEGQKVTVKSSDGRVQAVVDKSFDDAYDAYNTVYTKVNDTLVCLGENYYSVAVEKTGGLMYYSPMKKFTIEGDKVVLED